MWASQFGHAAGEPPAPEQIERWRRHMSVPENEIPAGVGLAVVLGRSDDAAVGITHVEAFSTGFRFTLAVRVRQARPDLVPGRLFMLAGRHLPPGVQIPVEDRLLLGIEYPDGRRASTVHDSRMPDPTAWADEERLVLVPQGGGGGDLSVDHTYWVSPLPPAGPVTVVVAWSGFGIPESRTVLDGAAVRAAAGRSVILWPPQPVSEPRRPPPPPRPPSGWFAEPEG